MADATVQLQRATQNLSRAYNAYQGSSFASYFAAQLQPQLSEEQRQLRLQVLRMMSDLVETEFSKCMDDLVKAWTEYKEALRA